MIAGQIEFDTSENWIFTQNPSSSGVNFLAVAIREVGHAIGLGHSNDPSSLMYPYLYDQRGPTLKDAAAIREIYGANSSDTTPDTEVAGSGSQDVFRFYNTATGVHFHTASETELVWVFGSNPTHRYEGIAYHVDAA